MQTASGKNFLKAAGIFYIAAGGLSLITALIVHFVNWGKPVADAVGWLYHTSASALMFWKLTAANNILAMLERLHIVLPQINSISYLRDLYPEVNWYDNYLNYSMNPRIWSIILAFAAVSISIFIVFTGITAVKHCDTLKRTKLLLIFALINLVMMIFSAFMLVSVLSLLGCVIAVIYFIGALKNHRSYSNFYPETAKINYRQKIIKYAAVTGASVLCMIILFIPFLPKTVQIIPDSRFYLNGGKENAYFHIIDENRLKFINFDMDSLTKLYEERLGFAKGEIESIQKLYSGEIEFELESTKINLKLPRYKGYDIAFRLFFKDENTIIFSEEEYIKQY